MVSNDGGKLRPLKVCTVIDRVRETENNLRANVAHRFQNMFAK